MDAYFRTHFVLPELEFSSRHVSMDNFEKNVLHVCDNAQ